MNYREIIVDRDGPVAIVRLNRPEKLNALGSVILTELGEAIEQQNDDDEVRALVLTGEGRGFCSGADQIPSEADKAEPEPSRGVRIEPFTRFGRVVRALRATRMPTFAAVNGVSAGAGLSLALLCDIRFASDQARFSAIFTRRGLVADTGTSYLLPRLVGIDHALKMMYTGDLIDAQEALRIRLVTEVVPHTELMERTMELAGRVARGPSVSIELQKRMVYTTLEANSFESAVAFEGFAQNVVGGTEDAKEGGRSFLERREANFKGR